MVMAVVTTGKAGRSDSVCGIWSRWCLLWCPCDYHGSRVRAKHIQFDIVTLKILNIPCLHACTSWEHCAAFQPPFNSEGWEWLASSRPPEPWSDNKLMREGPCPRILSGTSITPAHSQGTSKLAGFPEYCRHPHPSRESVWSTAKVWLTSWARFHAMPPTLSELTSWGLRYLLH